MSRAARIAITLALLIGIATIPTTNASVHTPMRSQAVSNPASSTQTQLLGAVPRKTTREIFGYALYNSLADPRWGYTTWNFSLLSTVAYFAVHIAPNGQLTDDPAWTMWNSSTVTNMINVAHANGTKVVMTIDRHDFAAGTPTMCSTLFNRVTTVLQTANAVRVRGVDGVNIDYESVNGTCPNGQSTRSQMTDLVRLLRAQLGSSSYISVATYASSGGDPAGFFDVPGMAPYADSFFVMDYDFSWPNATRPPVNCVSYCMGPGSPLANYFWNDTRVMNDYVAAVPASKVIMGLPYYGRKACVTRDLPHSYPTGSADVETYLDFVSEAGDPSVRPGSYAVHRDPLDPGGLERYDTWFDTVSSCIREVYIDDPISLGKKYDLANQMGLRGVGFWTLNYGGGSPELWRALADHFSICTAVSTSTSLISPQPSGSQIQITAAAADCPNPLYQFWILPPGGTWTVAQAYSSAPGFTWRTPAGKPGGSYLISVWARDRISRNSYDSFNAIPYTLTPTCAGVTVGTRPSGAAGVGNAITLTAIASVCPNPLYQFWILRPGGAWTVAQDSSTSATFRWDSANQPAGSYWFSVWVRDTTSPGIFSNTLGRYDAFKAFTYLMVPMCGSVSATAAPPSTTTAGSSVTINAAASGCTSPLYEIWVLPPGGAWTLVRGYAAGASFTWNTAGKPKGTYLFSVWVRDAGSPGYLGKSPHTYDAYSSFQYSLT